MKIRAEAAGIIALGAFVMFGILLYRVGEYMNMYRCGCSEK